MKAAPVELLVVRPEAYWDKTEADPLFRLLYCDGVPLKIGVGGNFRLKATLWKNMSVKFSRLLVPLVNKKLSSSP